LWKRYLENKLGEVAQNVAHVMERGQRDRGDETFWVIDLRKERTRAPCTFRQAHWKKDIDRLYATAKSRGPAARGTGVKKDELNEKMRQIYPGKSDNTQPQGVGRLTPTTMPVQIVANANWGKGILSGSLGQKFRP